MKLAYIFFAYTKPELLIRIIKRLDAEGATFLIHVDKKIDDAFIHQIEAAFPAKHNLFFTERVTIEWGDPGFFNALMLAFKELETRNIDYDYAFTLSTQDYPIKSQAEMQRILASYEGKQLLEYMPMPNPEWANGGMHRIDRYHFWVGKRRFAFPPNILRKTLPIIPKRKLPHGYQPYAGSNWFNFTKEAIQYINEFVETDIGKDLVRFYSHTYIASESFFHTVLLNSPFKDQCVNDELRYVKWGAGEARARVITVDDFEALKQSHALFARKADDAVDSDILDMIDRELLGMTSIP